MKVRRLRGHADDLRGLNRMTIDGIAGVVDIVEAMHRRIASVPGFASRANPGRTTGIARLVYRSIHGVVGLVGDGLDRLLARLAPFAGEGSAWPGREALQAALNGVVGDYLAASGNPLAIRMSLRRGGVTLPLERDALAAAIPDASGRLLVLVHGLCMNDLLWQRDGHDHGAALATRLGCTPVYLHYNSGRHVSENGREFAAQLEALARAWPVPLTELAIVGHSMGGLVAHSACHYGEAEGHAWRRQLRRLVFMGTPHHGAPLERGGSWVDLLLGASAYSAPLARLGKIRSAGITDLRHGSLVDEDWRQRDRFAHGGPRRAIVPLPEGVACYAIAAVTARGAGHIAGRLLGDGLVRLDSALGRHPDPARALAFEPARQRVFYRTNHLQLLSRKAVCAQLERWLAAPA